MAKNNLELKTKRLLQTSRLLSQKREIEENELIGLLIKEDASNNLHGKEFTNLRNEVMRYVQILVDLKIIEKYTRPRPGMLGYKDIMYRLLKNTTDIRTLIEKYLKNNNN